MTAPGTPVEDRHRVTAMLGLYVESLMGRREMPGELRAWARSPWDLWWVAYRAGAAASEQFREVAVDLGRCGTCTGQVLHLLAEPAPAHPHDLPQEPCPCMRSWAVRMRSRVAPVRWPEYRAGVALTKPGADAARIVDLLCAEGCTIVSNQILRLTTPDVRRLYPEAYGAQFIQRQDTYLTSDTSRAVVLLLPPAWSSDPVALKTSIRAAIGGTDQLRNHLHMPDNPAEAVCDLLHLTGWPLTEELYERHERDRAWERTEGYRRVVERGPAQPRALRGERS
jgi:nucleoside diphosphate kinase